MVKGLHQIGNWLPVLWNVGVELGSELRLVHESLKFCKTSYEALGNTESE